MNRTSTVPRHVNVISENETEEEKKEGRTECEPSCRRQRPTETDEPESGGAGEPVCECFDGFEAAYDDARAGADEGHGGGEEGGREGGRGLYQAIDLFNIPLYPPPPPPFIALSFSSLFSLPSMPPFYLPTHPPSPSTMKVIITGPPFPPPRSAPRTALTPLPSTRRIRRPRTSSDKPLSRKRRHRRPARLHPHPDALPLRLQLRIACPGVRKARLA